MIARLSIRLRRRYGPGNVGLSAAETNTNDTCAERSRGSRCGGDVHIGENVQRLDLGARSRLLLTVQSQAAIPNGIKYEDRWDTSARSGQRPTSGRCVSFREPQASWDSQPPSAIQEPCFALTCNVFHAPGP
ncbi:hypothetical protein AcV5_007917 [Taiwanofungus camphoratus]|nr:hypothetical protein AcW2_007562 [Antrodia cinnamomea]KAI0927364.1 hypothetical protein AcV5_007917 [Antrodia cinnamomea]